MSVDYRLLALMCIIAIGSSSVDLTKYKKNSIVIAWKKIFSLPKSSFTSCQSPIKVGVHSQTVWLTVNTSTFYCLNIIKLRILRGIL